MRTAQEMLNFVKTNGYGYVLGNKLKLFIAIEKELEPNDDVKFVFCGMSFYVGRSQRICAFTNEKLFIVSEKFSGFDFDVIRLSEVASFSAPGALRFVINFKNGKEVTTSLSWGQPNKVLEGVKRLSEEKVVQAGTMPCPKCKENIKDTDKFCPKCGASVLAKCSKCDHDMKAGAKFCPNCGVSQFGL